MTIRPNVVALVSATDLAPLVEAMERGTWTPELRLNRDNGTPLTDDEMALVGSATRREVEAARDFAELARSFHTAQLADMDRVGEILTPHFDQLPGGATVRDIWPLLTDAERAELAALMDVVAPGDNPPHEGETR